MCHAHTLSPPPLHHHHHHHQIGRRGPKKFKFYLLSDALCFTGKLFAGLRTHTVLPLCKLRVGPGQDLKAFAVLTDRKSFMVQVRGWHPQPTSPSAVPLTPLPPPPSPFPLPPQPPPPRLPVPCARSPGLVAPLSHCGPL